MNERKRKKTLLNVRLEQNLLFLLRPLELDGRPSGALLRGLRPVQSGGPACGQQPALWHCLFSVLDVMLSDRRPPANAAATYQYSLDGGEGSCDEWEEEMV